LFFCLPLALCAPSAWADDSHASKPPRIILTKEKLDAIRANPRWPAFRTALNRNLEVNVALDTYQGSHLAWVTDYALGYQLLKDSEPEAASRYADKALGLMRGALHDYQKGNWQTLEVAGRGDGRTVTFRLPHSRPILSSMRVLLAPVVRKQVVRGAGPRDEFDWYSKVLAVSDGADESSPYTEGVDWFRNGDVLPNCVDWLPNGRHPPSGSAYHITSTQLSAGLNQVSPAQVTEGTVTLSAPPTPQQVVVVQYLYGSYQQTSLGDGGFNSILVDTGYSSRFLGKHLAMGLDWLDGYPGFPPDLRRDLIAMLVRWSDYVRDHGYWRGSPVSNYGAGHYVSRVMTALALRDRSPEAPRLIREVLDYRQHNAVPALRGDPPSLKGGFWAEGWNYGVLATENTLLPGYALEIAGLIGRADAEREWASEVIKHLLAASPAPGQIFGGGDWFSYPPPFPPPTMSLLLGSLASDPDAAAYAAFALQGIPLGDNPRYVEMLFPGSTSAPKSWQDLSLNHLSSGTGFVALRSDWGAQSVWLGTLFGNLVPCDHQTYSPGLLQINRGPDALVVDANAVATNQEPRNKSQFSNALVVDDGGAGVQTYRYNMGFWYGRPGVRLVTFEEGASYTRVLGDYGAAYSKNDADGQGGPVSSLTRQIVYLRPNRFIIYDSAATKQPGYLKQLRFHALTRPALDGDRFLITSGQSTLVGQILSPARLKTEASEITLENRKIWQIRSNNLAAAERVSYTTLLQIEPSSQQTIESGSLMAGTDRRSEGVRFGRTLVVFVRAADGLRLPRIPVAGPPLRYLIFGLKPTHTYSVTGMAAGVTTNRFGTLSFELPPGAGIVTVR
jgi:hypothetical protein